jgi:hypothetical protein
MFERYQHSPFELRHEEEIFFMPIETPMLIRAMKHTSFCANYYYLLTLNLIYYNGEKEAGMVLPHILNPFFINKVF